MLNYTRRTADDRECQECQETFYDEDFAEMGMEDPDADTCPDCYRSKYKRRLRKMQQSDSVNQVTNNGGTNGTNES